MSFRSGWAVLFAVTFAIACTGETADSPPSEEMAEGHTGDTPTATEAARDPTVSVQADTVTYGQVNDTDLTGYRAVPANADSVLRARGYDPSSVQLPGLLVLHEWWGLNENIRTATRRLAGEGYRALAVDLYNDSTAETPAQAQSLMSRATDDPDQLRANVRVADEYLRTTEYASRVGVIGWCFGGGIAFRAMADRPSAFDAAVAYYGSPEALTPDVLKEVTTPILAHFGRQDEVVSSEQVDRFQDRVRDHDATVRIHKYDAGHAFANPSGERYDPQAARTAWSRTTRFLQMHLYPPSVERERDDS